MPDLSALVVPPVKNQKINLFQAGQKGVEINEIFDSDEEEDDEGVVSDGKIGKIRRNFIHHNNQVQPTPYRKKILLIMCIYFRVFISNLISS